MQAGISTSSKHAALTHASVAASTMSTLHTHDADILQDVICILPLLSVVYSVVPPSFFVAFSTLCRSFVRW
jgi:hypothetical protein